MRYTMKSLYIPDMGTTGDIVCSDSPMETKEENALWEINSMRRHDGLDPLTLNELYKHKPTFIEMEN